MIDQKLSKIIVFNDMRVIIVFNDMRVRTNHLLSALAGPLQPFLPQASWDSLGWTSCEAHQAGADWLGDWGWYHIFEQTDPCYWTTGQDEGSGNPFWTNGKWYKIYHMNFSLYDIHELCELYIGVYIWSYLGLLRFKFGMFHYCFHMFPCISFECMECMVDVPNVWKSTHHTNKK